MEIVRRGGNGEVTSSLTDFMERVMQRKEVTAGQPTLVLASFVAVLVCFLGLDRFIDGFNSFAVAVVTCCSAIFFFYKDRRMLQWAA